MRLLMTLALGIAAMLGSAAYAADYKIVERSDKKLPEWVYDTPHGTILVEVEASNLGEAQSSAELELKRRIISAVATNISHSANHHAEESWDGDTHAMLERFSTDTRTQAATMPFLKGVTMARAKATYWELREDKDTKRRTVVYSVLYPLSTFELEDMTAEFERIDRGKSDELADLRRQLATVDSSDAIQDALGRLEALQAYFFDKTRQAEAKAVAKSYNELYKGLTLSGQFYGDQLVCQVRLNGRPFRVSARPELQSNCASGLRAEHSDDGDIIIHYRDEDCLDNEENWIQVSLRLKTGRLSERFTIPARTTY